MKLAWIVMGFTGLAAAGGFAAQAVAQETEQPEYAVISSEGDIEIREYQSMIVAEASVPGEQGRAMSRGFRIIADYIFGNNISSQEIAMTSPVTQQASEKIAMTSPVTQQASQGEWQIRFIMPSEYTMETLPKPANPAVSLLEVPAKRVAVIRFSGMGREQALEYHEAKLAAYLASNDLMATAAPTYAFYDGPWTPPQRRRNEVMVELAR